MTRALNIIGAVCFVLVLVTFPLWAWFVAAIVAVGYMLVLGLCRAAARPREMTDEEIRAAWRSGKCRVRYSAKDIAALERDLQSDDPTNEEER
jgi:hypothetical protein